MTAEPSPSPPAAPRAPAAFALPRETFALRRAALIELGLFFALALALDSAFFGGTRLESIQPHPFWIPVLLLSAQYGTTAGLVAALAAILALRLGNMPVQGLRQDLYEYLFEVTKQPLAWLVTAVLFGELRMRHIRERDDLNRSLELARTESEGIAKAYRDLKRLKDGLEGRVAGQLRTVFTLYEAARAIDKLQEAEVIQGVPSLVNTVMKPRKFSLFMLQAEGLHAVTMEGWTAEDGYSRSFSASSMLFEQVIGRQRHLCAARREDERLLRGEGLLAGPLISSNSGEVVGMLKIESLGFVDLTVHTVENFRILCQWVGTAIAKARQYQKARESSLVSDDGTLYSSGFFTRQAEFLGHLGRRMGFPTSTVMIRPTELAGISAEQRRQTTSLMGKAVAQALRNTDMAFDYGYQGAVFGVILPGTPLEGAKIAANKLERSIRASLPEEYRDLPIDFIAEQVGAPD
jgi:hypothetical protein